jgi:hypothetical protein
VALSVGDMIRMGEEVAQLQPNATVVRYGGDGSGVCGDELADDAPCSDQLNIHTRPMALSASTNPSVGNFARQLYGQTCGIELTGSSCSGNR